MTYNAIVYKVMIASPSDVVPERAIVREVLAEWNTVNADLRKTVLLPVSWETHVSPTMGDRPQAIINKQVLKDCDLLVGVFWTRLGTPTGDYASGSVEEFEEHIKAGKPAMLYFSSSPVRPDSVDAEQYAELKSFKESCKSRGIFKDYTDLSDFKEKFYRHLQLKLNQDEYFKLKAATTGGTTPEAVESILPDIPNLSKEAQVLLKEACRDPGGAILRLGTMSGFIVQTNNKQMVADDSPRTRAIWNSAVNELQDAGLIADRGHEGKVFDVTKKGYELAEFLNP